MPQSKFLGPKELDTSCLLVQMQGMEVCETCPLKNTTECGGDIGNVRLIKDGKKLPSGGKHEKP